MSKGISPPQRWPTITLVITRKLSTARL